MATASRPGAPMWYSALPVPSAKATSADECLSYVSTLLDTLVHAAPFQGQHVPPELLSDSDANRDAPSGTGRPGLRISTDMSKMYGVPLPLPRVEVPNAARQSQMHHIQSQIETLLQRSWQSDINSPPSGVPSRRKTSPLLSPTSRQHNRKSLPYPLSTAQPQSSAYPLSYPMGMGDNGPVLLTCPPVDSSSRAASPIEKSQPSATSPSETSEDPLVMLDRYNNCLLYTSPSPRD